MTVAQLIECLRALPQDLPVYLGDWNEGYQMDIPIDYTDADRSLLLPRVAAANGPSRRAESLKYDDSLPRRVVIG